MTRAWNRRRAVQSAARIERLIKRAVSAGPVNPKYRFADDWQQYRERGLVVKIGNQEFIEVGASARRDGSFVSTGDERSPSFDCENPAYINLIPGATYNP